MNQRLITIAAIAVVIAMMFSNTNATYGNTTGDGITVKGSVSIMGDYVNNFNVTIKNHLGDIKAIVKTDDTGRFSVHQLPPNATYYMLVYIRNGENLEPIHLQLNPEAFNLINLPDKVEVDEDTIRSVAAQEPYTTYFPLIYR